MKPKLSVIMPCYNVAQTLARALDSVFSQTVGFPYEVILVNDASTDDTLSVAEAYAREHPHMRILNNEENQGNAVSFFNGLSSAKGDYFCVLDGDDYYTLPTKFQKQADFLDADTKREYVGCCHSYIVDLGGGRVHVPDCRENVEFNYMDFITQTAGYYHTATHMYRNIFRNRVPEYFRQKIHRGDTPRTLFHLMFSAGKIKVMSFVGSAYTFLFDGLWSSMSKKEQFAYQLRYFGELKQILHSETEQGMLDDALRRYEKALETASDGRATYPPATVGECLYGARNYAADYAYKHIDYMTKGIFRSEYLDTLCVSLGMIHRLYHPEQVQREIVARRLAILVGRLVPTGGGIYREIGELTRFFPDWQIRLIVAERPESSAVDDAEWTKQPNVQIVFAPEDAESKLSFLSSQLAAFKPERLYAYCSHSDVYTAAALQPGPCRNICLFSFDQGYLTGLENPFIDAYIAKRPVDYALLKRQFGAEKVRYIPTWNDVRLPDGLSYRPFSGHKKLVTASGAARFMKLNGGRPYRYVDYVVDLLEAAKGVHYHFGPIPEDTLGEINARIAEKGLPPSCFVHVAWCGDLPKFCLEHRIDVFIEPFPAVSYKLTLDMMAAGIPVIAFDGFRRLEIADFLYRGAMKWRTEAQFLGILTGVTGRQLARHSEKASDYFKTTHAPEVIGPCYVEDRSFDAPPPAMATDPNIPDVRDYPRLFGDLCRIKIMSRLPPRAG